MARGFNITVSIQSVDDLNEAAIATELAANGQLTSIESGAFIPGAVAAASILCKALPGGPFLVNIHGVDHTQEDGEETDLHVSVVTLYTVSELPEPDAPSAAETVPAAPVGPPLSITSPAAATFTSGVEGSLTITTERATGAPTPVISVVGDPVGLTFTDNGNGTATLEGTVLVEATELVTFAINAVSGEETATQEFDLTVEVAEAAPATPAPAAAPAPVADPNATEAPAAPVEGDTSNGAEPAPAS